METEKRLLADDFETSFSLEALVGPARPEILKESRPLSVPRTEKTGNEFLTVFGLKRHPFGDSLDTRFFFRSGQHQEALIKMEMSIENDISFGLVTGTSGTGKTILSQALLERLDLNRFHPVLVPATPGFSKSAFLRVIFKSLEINLSPAIRDIHGMIEILSQGILDAYSIGIKPVILIDEAHFLSSQALHLLRTLSNVEAQNKKLSTCILFAENTFLRRLGNPSYASLKNRMYLEIQLEPLDYKETKKYIRYRLDQANAGHLDLFSEENIDRIYELSHGIPRNINKEATKLMMGHYLALKR